MDIAPHIFRHFFALGREPFLERYGERLTPAVREKLIWLEKHDIEVMRALGGPPWTIVHGDFRLDNTMVNDDGNIAAVLDWEMSTLGDPLADLGILRMYWRDRDASGELASIGNMGVITLPGFPSWDEGRARYEEKSGRSLGDLDFYIALANFKLGVILENMHARFKAGGTVGAGFEMIGAQVLLLARTGLAVADASSIPALRGE
jgi:aminoglycoside phosphotransferase (APT) family kinase protein